MAKDKDQNSQVTPDELFETIKESCEKHGFDNEPLQNLLTALSCEFEQLSY